MAEEAKKETKPQGPVYYVENTVRRVGTRLHRMKAPTRHRFKLFIGGQRLLRNRKMPLTAAQMEMYGDQVNAMVLAGQVALYTPEGVRITSTTDGRLIYTKPSGAVKVADAPQKDKEPQPVPEPENVSVPDGEGLMTGDQPAELDDLTALPGIGSGRAKRLKEAGVTSFAGVVELGVAGLVSLLNLSEEAAAEVVEAAGE